MEKKWYLSKTIWLNLVMGMLMTLGAVVPSLMGVKDWIAANVALVGGVWSVLGIVLRAVSKDKIVLSD